jgi:protein gp37
LSNKSKIEWLDGGATWNPVTGCTPVSEACTNCYARRMATRLKGRYGYPADEPFRVTLHPERIEEPLHIKKPSRIFVCSMGDIFHDDVPTRFIDDVLEIIGACPQHTFMMLTKRPENIERKLYEQEYDNPLREFGGGDFLPNLWIGVTVENQARANERIPWLLCAEGKPWFPAALKFVSCEPLLGPIDLREAGPHVKTPLGWCIAGAETGPGKRPMDWQWAKDLQEDCHDASVPFFGKKFTDGSPILWRCFPQGAQP